MWRVEGMRQGEEGTIRSPAEDQKYETTDVLMETASPLSLLTRHVCGRYEASKREPKWGRECMRQGRRGHQMSIPKKHNLEKCDQCDVIKVHVSTCDLKSPCMLHSM